MSRKDCKSKFRNCKTKKTPSNKRNRNNLNCSGNSMSNLWKIKFRKKTTWKNLNSRRIKSSNKLGNQSCPKFRARKRMKMISESRSLRKIKRTSSSRWRKNKKLGSRLSENNYKRPKKSNQTSRTKTNSSNRMPKSV